MSNARLLTCLLPFLCALSSQALHLAPDNGPLSPARTDGPTHVEQKANHVQRKNRKHLWMVVSLLVALSLLAAIASSGPPAPIRQDGDTQTEDGAPQQPADAGATRIRARRTAYRMSRLHFPKNRLP